jgi:hypothetical protein
MRFSRTPHYDLRLRGGRAQNPNLRGWAGLLAREAGIFDIDLSRSG